MRWLLLKFGSLGHKLWKKFGGFVQNVYIWLKISIKPPEYISITVLVTDA